MEDHKQSVVFSFLEQRRERCGYCSSSDGLYSHGLYASILRPEDYQNMIDRGWRRSGVFCYKLVMDKTCCPSYTIRCAADDFKLSKTQKKILKRFNNFLNKGVITKNKFYKDTDITQPMETFSEDIKSKGPDEGDLDAVMLPKRDAIIAEADVEKLEPEVKTNNSAQSAKMNFSPAKEQHTKNKCMKAKYLRIQRKKEKLQKLGLSEEEIKKKLVEKKRYPVIKTIEDYVNENSTEIKVHSLKINLVKSCPRSKEFDQTFSVVFDLYKKYQTAIHKDVPQKLTESQFENFLVDSPLQPSKIYGSYHQQYWLDDKLIAVGVIDILPKCVSSVYFFYDPDYTYLSLGTYGALREVEFTRKLSRRFPDLSYYYMGFYIHSCVKMKYKGAFKPSYLLCPEAYTWHRIEECLKKLQITKYSRLNEDRNQMDEDSNISPSDVLILYKQKVVTLPNYVKLKKSPHEFDYVMKYAKLMGQKCIKKVIIFKT